MAQFLSLRKIPEPLNSIQTAIKSVWGRVKPCPLRCQDSTRLYADTLEFAVKIEFCLLSNQLKYLGFWKVCVLSSSTSLETGRNLAQGVSLLRFYRINIVGHGIQAVMNE